MGPPDPAAALGALGDPTRRRLVEHLTRAGPLSATDLAPAYPMSRQALTKHLATLADAGVLDSRREGREVRWFVVPDRIEEAAAWLQDVGRRWDDRLEALRRHLGAP